MNKILILSAMAFFAALMPIVPALACFPDPESETKIETEEVAFQFGRDPIPMSFCELPEPGFVVVNGKCYDFDAITDFETEEECQADEICSAYREEQRKAEEPEPSQRPPCKPSGDLDICIPWDDERIIEEPEPALCTGLCDDPNHGEIKGNEELTQDEEEHQEEEEQGQETGEKEPKGGDIE